MMREHRFRAMNTDVTAWLWSDSVLAQARLGEVETVFAQVESELSRFRPASGLSRLNAMAGAGPRRISPLFQSVLGTALDAADESGGIFDPTVLDSLSRAGYDRSFELLSTMDGDRYATHDRDLNRTSWRQVELDTSSGTARLPAGLGLDLGGIAKGWAVDRASEMLTSWGAALVDAGGDLRATAAPDGEPWPIAVQDPFDEMNDLFVISLSEGAIATSSIGKRRWERHGQTMHHLIDPRNGLPSQSDLHTVTVLAPTTAEAEVAAKVALILGQHAGKRYLDERGLSGVMIGIDQWLKVVGTPLMIDTVN